MVIDSGKFKNLSHLYSQTPPDFSQHNYYLNTLQKKVDADWPYRPNRKWVEEEDGVGTETYKPLEVVIQTVKNDKGEAISDDWYRLVFKDCFKVVRIGTRYRFAHEANVTVPDSRKNIWIALNQTQLSPTASQTVCRCNGTLGSVYRGEDGSLVRHYEPVIQPDKLTAPGTFRSEVAYDLMGSKMLIAQFNKYTQQYYINQRFFIDTNAYDKKHQVVYKITNIVASNTLTTYDPTDVGIIRIYYEVDQIGEQDDVENRIAYNGVYDGEIVPETDTPSAGGTGFDADYTFAIVEPKVLPVVLSEFTFKPQLMLDGVFLDSNVTVSCNLSGASYASVVPTDLYVSLRENEDHTFTIKRLKSDLTMVVDIVCSTEAPNGDTYELKFSLRLSD